MHRRFVRHRSIIYSCIIFIIFSTRIRRLLSAELTYSLRIGFRSRFEQGLGQTLRI
jgi:hypothetical protein